MGLLDGIKYVFQVPLEWYRSVDKRVFGDHEGPGVKFTQVGDGSRAIGVDFDEMDARYLAAPSSDGVLVSDADGKVTASKPQQSSDDLVMTYKSGASAPTWEKGGASSPENPQTFDTIGSPLPGTSTAVSSTWTAGGEKGLKLYEHTRTCWSGGVLYGFYRVKTYDRYGRLYSVSGETRYTIDTPVTYNP